MKKIIFFLFIAWISVVWPLYAETEEELVARHQELENIAFGHFAALKLSVEELSEVGYQFLSGWTVIEQARSRIDEMETVDEGKKRVFFEGVYQKPLTAQGVFYDNAHREIRESYESFPVLQNEWHQLWYYHMKQRRRYLEAKQRLANFEEDVMSGWENNPF